MDLRLAQRIKYAANITFTEPPGYRGRLRSYQKKGVAWLYCVEKGGLFDACGTGKTHHAMALQCLLKARGELGTAVTLVPAASILQWKDEYRDFTRLNVGVAVGDKGNRVDVYTGAFDVILVSYQTMLHDFEHLKALQPSTVILDEASMIKNASTKTAQLVKELTRGAQRVVLLSATPIQNNLMDLHSAMEALHLNGFPSRVAFRNRYCVVEKRSLWYGGRRRVVSKIVGYRNVNELIQMIEPFYLRRTIRDVESELPALVAEQIWLDLLPEQRRFYEKTREALLSLGDLRQVRNNMHYLQKCVDGTYTLGIDEDHSCKLDRLMDLLTGDLAEEKAVVFSFYKRTLHALQMRLQKEGIGYVVFTGDESKEDRRAYQRRFFKDPACRVAMGTTALEMSLNLQAARYMITLDLLWNPTRVEQLVGRIRRAGSTHGTVVLLMLLTAGTLEQRMMDILRRKQALPDYVFGEQSDIFQALTTEELMELIRG